MAAPPPPPLPRRGKGGAVLTLQSASPCFPAQPLPHGGGGGIKDLSCLAPEQGGDVSNCPLRALVSATLWAVLPLWHCLVSGTPSLSYMPLISCVMCSFPPWQTWIIWDAQSIVLGVFRAGGDPFWPMENLKMSSKWAVLAPKMGH